MGAEQSVALDGLTRLCRWIGGITPEDVTVPTDPNPETGGPDYLPDARGDGLAPPPESLAEMRARIGRVLRHRINVAIRGAVLWYVNPRDGHRTPRPSPEHLARVRASLPSGRFRVTGPTGPT